MCLLQPRQVIHTVLLPKTEKCNANDNQHHVSYKSDVFIKCKIVHVNQICESRYPKWLSECPVATV